ncbi:radical SAM domain protein [Leptospira ryugenii]|uniref:Radical SAM domain protein n=1 Tax=Leptospira ryugenii TaxID=1917863 RepID=A0A2P2DVQ3_9LEPT|nr:B12-binding domain-containing radical SAM protein [Leptospira ryugenii]GBF48687.1 radical SAM domain protein [Leptospira ryugenii]
MANLQLLQLPVPPPSYYAATGNVPLAAASLASSLEVSGLSKEIQAETILPEFTDRMGDQELVDYILSKDPDFLGLSLYLWNTERSLHLAKELKKRNADLKILIGGPEVNEDNPFVLSHTSFDLAVRGESEHHFGYVMEALLGKREFSSLSDVAYRTLDGGLSPFLTSRAADFPLAQFPSPYLTGHLAVEGNRSTYLETVRGCKSQCTYCFYPKSSQNLRTLDIDETKKLIIGLKDKGARELVFLDPTFNHRPGFEAFLDSIAEVNSDGQMNFFAELRSEGVSPKLAKKLAKAGFNRIELGMQSINPETLKRVKRYGDPNKVAEVAKMLVGEGIELLLDLIVGLPGDKPEDVERGLHFFVSHGLEEWVQVFPLSVLPGTAMRRDAQKEGITFIPYPPYRVVKTHTFSEEDIILTMERAEEILDRRVDEYPRPYLCLSEETKEPTYVPLDEMKPSEAMVLARRPGERHQAVWFATKHWERHIETILQFLSTRIELDPYCTLDVILYTEVELASHYFQRIKQVLDGMSPNFLTRALAHRGENLQRRLLCIAKPGLRMQKPWINAMLDHSDVRLFLEADFHSMPKDLSQIGINLPSLWLTDRQLGTEQWQYLKTNIDPEGICFKETVWEKRWSLEVLGYGEV